MEYVFSPVNDFDRLEEQLRRLYGPAAAPVQLVRYRGLIQGLEFAPDVPVALIVRSALLEQKLVLISAEHNTIRFIPPLVVTEAEIDEMARRLAAII